MQDSYQREINYIRISVTDRCNLRCSYCMPINGVEKKYHDDILSFEEIIQTVKVATTLGITKVRITGGEPLVRKGVVSLISDFSKIEGITDIGMTTNGVLFKDFAKELKSAGLNRINISIDSLRADRYKAITNGGDVDDVITSIDYAQSLGFKVKLNVVIMKGFNDDEIMDFAMETMTSDIDVRFIELMPIGENTKDYNGKYISNEEIKNRFKKLIEIENTDGVSVDYKLPAGKGKIGFINPMSHQFCNACNKIRITSDGMIKTCLHSHGEINIREILKKGNEEELKKCLEKAIIEKPKEHQLSDINNAIERNMNQIGG